MVVSKMPENGFDPYQTNFFVLSEDARRAAPSLKGMILL
jgi:hypothetical protein